MSEVKVHFLKNTYDPDTLESFHAGQEASLSPDQAAKFTSHPDGLAEEAEEQPAEPAPAASPGSAPKSKKKGSSEDNPVPMGSSSS